MAAVLGRRRRARVVAVMAATAVAGISVTACSSSASGGGLSPHGSLQHSYQETISRALPSVVEISAGGSTGSGVVFNNRGFIVTNAHVVGNNTRFEVRTSVASEAIRARLVGIFAPDDLAVIKAFGKGPGQLRPVQWANSGKAQVGQIVLAMGSPYGLSASVTQGIISATGRTVQGAEIKGKTALLLNALQTSAAINPGNSGGALVLLSGKVIGMPTLTGTNPQNGAPAGGIGFAIPANTVRSIASQLISKGKVTKSGRASLDIEGETHVNSEHAPDGVAVTRALPGGAAAKAGIKNGDVIAGIDGHPTPDIAALDNVLAQFSPGDRVKIEVLRGGNPRQVMARLSNLGSPPPASAKGKHKPKPKPKPTPSHS